MDLLQQINQHKPEVAQAAQKVYDSWEQDENGNDPELGSGGICDLVAYEISKLFSQLGYEVVDGGQLGYDHAYIYVHDNTKAFVVDIPPRVYERGGGYNWRKIPGITISPSDVIVYEVSLNDVLGSTVPMAKEQRIAFLKKNIELIIPKIEKYNRDVEEYGKSNGIYQKLSPEFRAMRLRIYQNLLGKAIDKKVNWSIELDELEGVSRPAAEAYSPQEVQEVRAKIAALPRIFNQAGSRPVILDKLREALEDLPQDLVDGAQDVLDSIEEYEDTPKEEKADFFEEIKDAVGEIKMAEEEFLQDNFSGWKKKSKPAVRVLNIDNPTEPEEDWKPVAEEAPPAKPQPTFSASPFPTHMTMDEYEAKWKKEGWKIIFIGPTATWRSEWGTWEAVRELVQNALDETESYEYGFDKLGFYILDEGRGVGVSSFLLGPPKLKEDWTRGKYGEGMKIGGLALVRAGYPVYVETVGRQLFIVFLEQETDSGKVETLAALWKDGPRKQGTIFHIIGYDGDDYADRFFVNMPDSWIVAKVPSQINKPQLRYLQMMQKTFPQASDMPVMMDEYNRTPLEKVGRIYARDIFMMQINSPFTYNLWDFDLAPDRHAPKDENSMWLDVARLWCGVRNKDLIKTFLQMVSEPPILRTSETGNVRFGWMGNSAEEDKMSYERLLVGNQKFWQEAWREQFGNGTVLQTNDRWNNVVAHIGYASKGVQWAVRDQLSKILKTDVMLVQESQEALREVNIIPDAQLAPGQLAHLELVRATVETMYRNSYGKKPAGVHAAIIPAASDRVRTAGMYSRITTDIYVDMTQLDRARTAVDVGIHEMAHHISEAEDGDTRHYQTISSLAALVVRDTADGDYDEIIQKPGFVW